MRHLIKIFRKSQTFPKISKFSENLKIFRKSQNFPKISETMTKTNTTKTPFENFWKFWNFRKILRFLENFEIFGKFWDFRKILRFLEKVWDFRKTLIKCLKGYKSLGSLCNVEIKNHWVSQLVTRSPIELFWTAKKHPVGR